MNLVIYEIRIIAFWRVDNSSILGIIEELLKIILGIFFSKY